jgi:hypothetical protein
MWGQFSGPLGLSFTDSEVICDCVAHFASSVASRPHDRPGGRLPIDDIRKQKEPVDRMYDAWPQPRYGAATLKAVTDYSSRSRCASSSPSGNGQLRPPGEYGRGRCSPPPCLPPQAFPDRLLAQTLRQPQPQHLAYLPHRQSRAWHSLPPAVRQRIGSTDG